MGYTLIRYEVYLNWMSKRFKNTKTVYRSTSKCNFDSDRSDWRPAPHLLRCGLYTVIYVRIISEGGEGGGVRFGCQGTQLPQSDSYRLLFNDPIA